MKRRFLHFSLLLVFLELCGISFGQNFSFKDFEKETTVQMLSDCEYASMKMSIGDHLQMVMPFRLIKRVEKDQRIEGSYTGPLHSFVSVLQNGITVSELTSYFYFGMKSANKIKMATIVVFTVARSPKGDLTQEQKEELKAYLHSEAANLVVKKYRDVPHNKAEEATK